MIKRGFLPYLSLNLPHIGPKMSAVNAFAEIKTPIMISEAPKVLAIPGNKGNIIEYPITSIKTLSIKVNIAELA